MSSPEEGITETVRRIVVPLDESRLSEMALDLAVPIASRSQASLVLITVPLLHQIEVEQQLRHAEMPRQPPAIPTPEELVEMSEAEARQYLAGIQRQLRGRAVESEARVVHRAPAEAIVELAEEVQADLIVMATHGRGGLSRWALGSVADKVLQTAGRPVLLTRSSIDWSARGPQSILVPLDGSALAEIVLPQAAALARLFGAALRLVRVVVQYESEGFRMRWKGQSESVEDLREHWAEEYLAQKAAELRAQGQVVHTEVVEARKVAEALLEIEQRETIDLVTMSTHGLGGLKRWAFGSVADRLIRSAETPLLLVPARPDEDQD